MADEEPHGHPEGWMLGEEAFFLLIMQSLALLTLDDAILMVMKHGAFSWALYDL